MSKETEDLINRVGAAWNWSTGKKKWMTKYMEAHQTGGFILQEDGSVQFKNEVKTKYTVGVLFDPSVNTILLIEKIRPDWQKGLLNFPGGHTEEGESPEQCVAREFKEETNLDITPEEWFHIGRIENHPTYDVEVLTAIWNPSQGTAEAMTDEPISWHLYKGLDDKNCVTNIPWLTGFCYNFWNQGRNDLINFGIFKYEYPNQK